MIIITFRQKYWRQDRADPKNRLWKSCLLIFCYWNWNTIFNVKSSSFIAGFDVIFLILVRHQGMLSCNLLPAASLSRKRRLQYHSSPTSTCSCSVSNTEGLLFTINAQLWWHLKRRTFPVVDLYSHPSLWSGTKQSDPDQRWKQTALFKVDLLHTASWCRTFQSPLHVCGFWPGGDVFRCWSTFIGRLDP